jgi:hypothetical protein
VRTIKSNGTLNDLGKLYGLAQAATKNVKLSEGLARPDVLVSMALLLKDIPLDRVTLVQYPTVPIGNGNRVGPNEALAERLFQAIADDLPVGLDAEALDTGHGGSTVDPSAPTPAPTSTPSATPTPGATDDPGSEAVVIPGLKGQTAATRTCSTAN